MLRRILTTALLVTILALVGCSLPDALTIGRKASYKSWLDESEMTKTDTIYIYHKNGYVIKSVFVEEIVLKESSGTEDLYAYAAFDNKTYNRDIFKIEGLVHTTELTDESFTATTTLDYTKMDIKEELGEIGELFSFRNFVDKDFRILHDKMVSYYAQYDFVFEEQE